MEVSQGNQSLNEENRKPLATRLSKLFHAKGSRPTGFTRLIVNGTFAGQQMPGNSRSFAIHQSPY